MPSATAPQLFTALQLRALLLAWGQEPAPPRKHEARVILWPKAAEVECECARVTWTEQRSDIGQRLYAVEMGSAAQLFGPLKVPA